jgi:ribosomal protein L30E
MDFLCGPGVEGVRTMKLALLRVFSLAVLLAGAAQAQPQVQKIAGEVVKVEGLKLAVKAGSGQVVEVKLAADARFSGRSLADLAKLTPGAYVGTTAVAQADGTLVAREIHVFPESMRGTSEGHRPMSNEPGSTMTNATITGVGARGTAQRDTMTNATVAGISGAAGNRTLTLAYKGGEKTVVVPDNVPVAMYELADRSALVPGAHVIVYAAAQGDGTLAAERVTVGTHGFVPPQ